MKFIHRFSHGVSCELTVPDKPPPDGSMPITEDYIWTGKPRKKHVSEYMIWRYFEVQRQLCDLWNISYSEVIEFTPAYRQMSEYEPGKLPKMTVLGTDPERQRLH